MDSLCGDSPENRSQWPDFGPGTLTIVNTNNDVEHCFWSREKVSNFEHFIVLNLTSLKINCVNETVTFEDEEMCNVTLPHCVIYGEKECKIPSKYDDCSYHDSDDYENFLFHAKTTIKSHGLSLNYSFYKCPGYDQKDMPATFNTVQLPLIIALTVLVLIVVICICAKYRKLRKQNEVPDYQQYVTTVASQTTMVPDELPGSSLSFEFSRSYEEVPRGAAPLFDIYKLSAKRDINEEGTSRNRPTNNSSKIENNMPKNYTLQSNHQNNSQYVATKDFSQVTYDLANVARMGYDNVIFEAE